jgi:hypothetical protein
MVEEDESPEPRVVRAERPAWPTTTVRITGHAREEIPPAPRAPRMSRMDLPPVTERFDDVQAPPPQKRFAQPHLSEPPPAAMVRVQASPPQAYEAEPVEHLPMPSGIDDRSFPPGQIPRTAFEVRIASVRLARELGHDYAQRYGVHLKLDPMALDWMQRHLRERWPRGLVEGPQATRDVHLHGAVLSELLARSLGALWTDVAPSEVGYWAMFVPPRTRIWPFARVYRFIAMGHLEKDLISYYFDLRARAFPSDFPPGAAGF